MINSGKELANVPNSGTDNRARRSWRSYLRFALGVFIALAGCEVLMAVWRVAGDESRHQTTVALHALEQARTSAQRVEAIQDLVRPVVIQAPAAIPPLIRALDDPAPAVRVEAARALGPATSAAALIGIVDHLVTAAIAGLLRSLDDEEPAVRIAAAHTLGAIGASKTASGVIHPQALVDALAARLDDSDPTVRASTIAALGLAGSTTAPTRHQP